MSVKIAINGFGRIGRLAFRQMFGAEGYEVVAINDLTSPKMLAHLLKYDSAQGRYALADKVTCSEDGAEEGWIAVDGHKIRIYAEKDANNCPWGKLGVDVVLECTGFYCSKEKSMAHVRAGAKKVIISAPAGKDLPTIVFGVNENTLTKNDQVISAASCTTNCLGPVTRVLEDNFGIEKGLMTTIHAYTNGQSLLDVKCRDLRRSRTAAQNIIPTTTGAAKAMKLVMPSLEGKLHGQSVRVPVPNVSMVDLTAVLGKKTSKEELNETFVKASKESLKGIMLVDFDERVSTDFMTCAYSSIVAADLTQVICGDMIKVMAWYDNEWGYSKRLVEMAGFISK